MILTRKQVKEGAKVPRGYGYAWRDFDRNTTVAFPVPFNVFFRGLRRFWHWIVGGYKNSVIDEARIAGRREASRDWSWYEARVQEEVHRRMKILESDFDQRVLDKASWALKQVTDANSSK